MSYSQRGEDIIVQDFFGDFRGNLLSIGENDGRTFSNARLLLEQGWTGTLVEPSPRAFSRLLLAFPEPDFKPGQINCVLLAIAEQNGTQKFYESGALIGEDDHSLVSTLIEDETARWKRATKPHHRAVQYEETEVYGVTWETFYKSVGRPVFDFITIDAEGMDLAILRQMDLREIGCKCICIEHNGRNRDEFDKLIHLPLIHDNGTNLIYGSNEF